MTATPTIDADAAASDTLDALRSFAADPRAVSLTAIRAARAVVSQDALSASWLASLSEEARRTYNRCLETGQADTLLPTTHMRCLCLALLDAATETAPLRDADKAAHAKHWARTALQFIIVGEADEAARCLDTSGAHLRSVADAESIEVLECELHLCGHRAHLAWLRGDFRQVLRNMEEAHAMLEERSSGTHYLLPSSRLYLADQVAFRLARKGFELCDAAADTKPAEAAIERRQIIRLLDLALSLLGGSSPSAADALEEFDLAALKNKCLRLRAWLCMLEDEIDMATHSLNQHSTAASAEYMLLRCALLFRSNQPAEAAAQTLDWLRSETGISYAEASDAVRLLTDHQAHGSALAAVNVLSERIAAREELASPCAAGNALSKEYSDLQELKYKLLTEHVPDAAAAADHLEHCLDGHCSGRLPLEELTMRELAAKLWESGHERYTQGDLHRTVDDFERCFRFLENTRAKASQGRAQATLAHLYLQQDRLEHAVDRATHCLKLLQQHEDGRAAGGSDAADGGAADDDDDLESSRSLAQIILVKARVKMGDVQSAQTQIDALLAEHPDHMLLAAVCEELSGLGQPYHAASVKILEAFVARLAAMPAARAPALPTSPPPTAETPRAAAPRVATSQAETPETHPAQPTSPTLPAVPLAERSLGSSEKLAGAVRSLVAMRLQAKEGGDDRVASRELRDALLSDLRMIGGRLARDGEAVCDDPAHIDFLADVAWHLAWLEAQRMPSGAEGRSDAERSSPDTEDDAKDAVQTVKYCADFVDVSCELSSVLPATEARLHAMLRGQTVICRAALHMASLTPTGEPEERTHLSRASKATAAAFRLHQRYVQTVGAPPPLASADGKADPLPSTLQMINFEVALRKKDPNAKEVLRKVAEAESVSTGQLRVLAELSFDNRDRELGVVALEQALHRLLNAETKHYAEIAAVLRLLVRKATARKAAWPHFKTATRLLDGFSAANAPFGTDELQWFLAEAWNKGVAAFRENLFDEAENWMALAFSFTSFSSALAPWREELNDGYQVCLRMLNEMGPRSKAGDWGKRMSQRILEADEAARKRQRRD